MVGRKPPGVNPVTIHQSPVTGHRELFQPWLRTNERGKGQEETAMLKLLVGLFALVLVLPVVLAVVAIPAKLLGCLCHL